MQTSPAARCQHIRTSGTQCGSPALRNKIHCYYHDRWRPTVVNLSEPGKRAHFTIPILEDAHSIQFAIAQVIHQLMDKTIDTKTAGLMLYALQIASSNLRQLAAETPQPSQVVVDLDTVDQTPLEAAPSPVSAPQKATRKKNDEVSEEECQRQLDYLLELGRNLDEPADAPNPKLERLKKLADGPAEDNSDDNLPPGTIQACARRPRSERRSERRQVN